MNSKLIRIASAGAILCMAAVARADYLEVTRTATLRSEPTRDSDSLGRIDEGTNLALTEDSATSGYYHVHLDSGNKDGWVYKTFVKRVTGESPDVATSENPNETDVAVPDDHPWGQVARKTGCKTTQGLPDSGCTPGDILADEDESVICSTDFKTGTVRGTVTKNAKDIVYPAYKIPFPPAGKTTGKGQVCEIDHLVPLQLGGADTIANLWPQCSAGYDNWQGPGFRDKDGYENYLWFHVCKKQDVSLHDAQLKIATDWAKAWEQAGKPRCFSRANCKS